VKAMILGAGLGTRLRPLTEDRPKALVTVAGRTLLEMAILRLRASGVRELIVNVHHYADMICEYLKANDDFGMRIEVSREDALLDTGGGLKKAGWFFLDCDEPFLVHNVDVMSGIDLGAMVRVHAEQGALATIAVQRRKTSRGLVFDASGRLLGRAGEGDEARAVGFAGIHVVSPRIFSELVEVGGFSIIDAYVRLAGMGEKIVGFEADGAYWRDLGRVESVRQAEMDVESGIYTLG